MGKTILEKEEEFHNGWASRINVGAIRVDAHFEGSTSPENRFILRQMGDINGKRLLDLGCGAGENGVYFAQRGAICVVADYSPGMVKAALELAKKHNVAVEGRRINAMEIDFPENSFDFVYSSNLLHHVDPRKALTEIHRVLKPGGKVCFWDPLKHNPVINIYRKMAKEVRTADESPLDIDIIDFVRTLFSETVYDTFWICTLWIFLRFYLIERVDPNKERYWKKIIYEEERLRRGYNRLEMLDNAIKRGLPFLKRFAWNIAVVATK